MARRRRVAQVRLDQSFKGRQFAAEVILWAIRWYLMFPISYRDLKLMLADRGGGQCTTPPPQDPSQPAMEPVLTPLPMPAKMSAIMPAQL
jgi:hypothetical protein